MTSLAEGLDAGLYRAEKAVVAVILSVMGLVVFLDVMHRMSTREGSLLANPAVVAGVAAIVAGLACLTRGKPWFYGIIIGVLVAVAQQVYVRVLPSGLVWSQSFALALTLWMGMIGASLAAYERRHLALDVGSKLWPPSLAPKMASLGHILTALFCLGMLYLGWRSIVEHYDLWASTEGAAGNIPGIRIPKWAAVSAIPYGMAAMTLRFGLEAWRTWTGRAPVGGDDTLHQLGIETPQEPR